MRVLVTGAGGFLGSHVVEELLADSIAVRAFVRYDSAGSVGELEALVRDGSPRLEVVAGDVRDARLVREAASGCDAIVHLAALIGVPYSYRAVQSYLDTNVGGTLNVLEAARAEGTPRVVLTSTSEVYGTARATPIDESHPLQAQSPYAASKIAADQLGEAYHRSFDVPVVVLRPFNAYGPRQSARAVVPAIVSQLLGGAPALRLGRLEPRRDLTFVRDTARAFRLALRAEGHEGRTIHFGSGEAISVRDLAERCMEVTGRRVPIEVEAARLRPEKSEVGLLVADSSLARRLLGWKPTVNLEQGLERVVEYVRAHPQRYPPSGHAE